MHIAHITSFCVFGFLVFEENINLIAKTQLAFGMMNVWSRSTD